MKISTMGDTVTDELQTSGSRSSRPSRRIFPPAARQDIALELSQAVERVAFLFRQEQYPQACLKAGEYLVRLRFFLKELVEFLAYWHLSLLHAKALMYAYPGRGGAPRRIRRVLEQMEKSPFHQSPRAWEDGSRKEYQRLTGLAKHLLGYDAWKNQHDLQRGIDYTIQALEHYERIGDVEGMATLFDNLARMFAELGDQDRANAFHHPGLVIRVKNRHSSSYRLALSLISGGEIHILDNRLDLAEFQLNRAFMICISGKQSRGLGLVYLALGRLHRVKAAQTCLPVTQRTNLLYRAQEFLLLAEQIFRQKVAEPVRLIDACSELGSVNQTLASLFQPEGSGDSWECWRDSNLYFQEARALANHYHLPWFRDDPCTPPASEAPLVKSPLEMAY